MKLWILEQQRRLRTNLLAPKRSLEVSTTGSGGDARAAAEAVRAGVAKSTRQRRQPAGSRERHADGGGPVAENRHRRGQLRRRARLLDASGTPVLLAVAVAADWQRRRRRGRGCRGRRPRRWRRRRRRRRSGGRRKQHGLGLMQGAPSLRPAIRGGQPRWPRVRHHHRRRRRQEWWCCGGRRLRSCLWYRGHHACRPGCSAPLGSFLGTWSGSHARDGVQRGRRWRRCQVL
mmetsp:Transcript_4154/g.15528  ORF Transcript_4154/g.15528 Transcript_4154/m.15528 type:complete len:231 (+) Transcript_4154:2297-2989(+)